MIKRIIGKGLFACMAAVCILCGCTRREQLVLETGGESVGEKVEAAEAGQGASDDDAAGQVSLAVESQNTAPDVGEDAAAIPVTGAAGQTGKGSSGTEVGEQIQSGEVLTICVHVCGAVKNPGVYEMVADSRVFEAVRAAGGFTAEADESYVNQAQRMTDGAKLVIPTIEQVKDAGGEGSLGEIGIVEGSGLETAQGYGVSAGSSGAGSTESASDGKININTASEAQLCEIPGIGATRAAAIVAYRQQSGGFSSTEDIMNVSGIKEGTYAKIKDRITVD